MSNFNFNPDEDFAPVDVNELGLTGEPTATFSLAPADIGNDGTATFNLTPSGDGDGMTFNLTPVLQQSPRKDPQYGSSAQDIDVGGHGYKEIHSEVMTFSPPIQMSPTGGLTPDFTGLLPPPPPPLMLASNGSSSVRSVPHLAQVIASASDHTASGHLPLTASVTGQNLISKFEQQPTSSSRPAFPYQKASCGSLNLSPPTSSQLSLLLQTPPQHSPPQYRQPPPPYKSPTYQPDHTTSPLIISPHNFPHDNVVRIAPSVTLTKKPRPVTTATVTIPQPTISPVSPRTQLSSPPGTSHLLPSSVTLQPVNTTQQLPNVSPHQQSRSPKSMLPMSPITQQPLSTQKSRVAPPAQTTNANSSNTSPRSISISTCPKMAQSPAITLHQITSSPLQPAIFSSPNCPMKSPPTNLPQLQTASSSPSSISPHKLPNYTLEELKDLPGVNLKKSSVDLNTYVNAVAKNMHPHFANVDSYAERCLACIVRKIRSNLPTLKALEDVTKFSKGGICDPGCILVPRMKDGRITIARPGGGAGGTKKIHPHLALVQIFKDPSVVNHNTLVNTSVCSSPFQGEGDVVCISPLHYQVDGKKPRAAVTPRKKTVLQEQLPSSDNIEYSKQPLSHNNYKLDNSIRLDSFNVQTQNQYELLSDSDDDTDWVEKWNTDSIVPEITGIQEFNEEDIAKQIQFLSLKTKSNGDSEYVGADDKIMRDMNVRQELLMLLKGKYNLDSLKDAVKPKEHKHATPISASKVVKRAYNRKPTVAKPAKKKNPGEAWVSEPNAVIGKPVQKSVVVPQVPVKTDEAETVIQSLLDDIKGSFESQFEMDLDPFGNTVGPAFTSQDFGMANAAFNLANFDDDSFGSSNTSREIFSITNAASAQSPGVASVSSDAMFSGVGLGADPTPGTSWSTRNPEVYSQSEYLSGDPLSQDQFLKMFDDDN